MFSGFGRCVGAATLIVGSLLSVLAMAQIQPPPRHTSNSPTGVSFLTGAFSLEEEDLSIGGGLPTGISLTRSYNSGTNGVGAPYDSIGWTNNFNIYITISHVAHAPGTEYPPNYQEQCIYNIAGGSASIGFVYTGGARTIHQTGCGPYIGNYEPINASGASLEYILEGGSYRYRYTSEDGSIINFRSEGIPRASDWTFADGTRLDFFYPSNTLKAVFSNRGWAILFENKTKTCAVNLTTTYITATSTCPPTAQTATYSYVAGIYRPLFSKLASVTNDGNTRNYQYAAENDHLSCVKDPGQSICRIQNTYFTCVDELFPGDPQQATIRLKDLVTSQTLGDGRTITYALDENSCPYPSTYTEPDYRPVNGATMTMTETGVPGSTIAKALPTGQLNWIRDPLGRLTSFDYQPTAPIFGFANLNEPGDLDAKYFPEGNGVNVSTRDTRGNITSKILSAKSGSGLANIVSTASYPAICTHRKICNKPESMTDANGQVTSYTYDPAHGGVLTETGPAVGGITPQKRYEYAQRYAWLLNAAGTGHVQASAPVWLLTRERYCRTTSPSGTSCVGGAADEVVTDYDYGPNSGPNNLLLRGIVIVADGQTLRTCYGYDTQGRKISETKPNANLSACP